MSKKTSKLKVPTNAELAPVVPPSVPKTEERRIADLTVRTTGSKHKPFQNQMMQSVCDAQWHHPKERPDDYSKSHAAFQAMRAFAPTDEIEAMIAAQAVGMHAATMECMSRAMIPDQSAEHATALRKSAVSLSRCFVELLGALDRKRGKSGQQTVTVEHVHVHQGGQAIVGTISPGTRGGGEQQPPYRTEPEGCVVTPVG